MCVPKGAMHAPKQRRCAHGTVVYDHLGLFPSFGAYLHNLSTLVASLASRVRHVLIPMKSGMRQRSASSHQTTGPSSHGIARTHAGQTGTPSRISSPANTMCLSQLPCTGTLANLPFTRAHIGRGEIRSKGGGACSTQASSSGMPWCRVMLEDAQNVGIAQSGKHRHRRSRKPRS